MIRIADPSRMIQVVDIGSIVHNPFGGSVENFSCEETDAPQGMATSTVL